MSRCACTRPKPIRARQCAECRRERRRLRAIETRIELAWRLARSAQLKQRRAA